VTPDERTLVDELYGTTQALAFGLAAVGAVVATRSDPAPSERLALALAALQWREVPCVFTGARAVVWAALVSLVELGDRLPRRRRQAALTRLVGELGGAEALAELCEVRDLAAVLTKNR
jgi:hypothetical protein